MESIRIEEIVNCSEGDMVSGNSGMFISGISIDSRIIQKNDLFIAIKGKNFDGHDFVNDVLDRGAAGVVIRSDRRDAVKQDKSEGGRVVVAVPDTIRTLGDIASIYRKKFNIPVIAVTGSNGKTTTKDIISTILSRGKKVVKTIGNYNNMIGVPLSVFRLDYDTDIGIFEMGMSNIGEIERLTEILNPDIGIITNIAPSHLEFLHTIENIIKAKREMLKFLSGEKLTILNADDPAYPQLMEDVKGRVKIFGIENNADIRAVDIRLVENSSIFKIDDTEMELPLAGTHNIYNALAAISAALELKYTLEEIRLALKEVKPPPMRMELEKCDNFVIINDAYNSNPRSMQEAVKTLNNLVSMGRKIIVMGDMLELGTACMTEHQKTGQMIAKSSIDFFLTVGGLARVAAEEATRSGFPEERVVIFENNSDCAFYLKNMIQPLDAVLVKGSRGMKMEEIVKSLKGGS